MAKTAKELKALNADTAIKNLPTEVPRPGRAAKLKDLAKEDSRVLDTYRRSEEMIERYGKDAPRGRSFMRYKNGGCVMAGRGSKYKGQM